MVSWRTRGLTLRFRSYALQIVPSVLGYDRWLICQHGAIRWAWSAPKWASFMRDDGKLRGGC